MCYVVGRFWHDKLQRPFWYHLAEGGTWRRPDGWRGTDYPFPIIVLRRHFRDWWSNAAVERMRRQRAFRQLKSAVERMRRHRAFRQWKSLWAASVEDDACWDHLDYASD